MKDTHVKQPIFEAVESSRRSAPAPFPTALTGLLVIHIVEGRGLRIPERQKEWTDEIYCVLELDGEHRARTGVSTWEQRFRWDETFEIDSYEARQLDIYVYSWHPQYRHKLCHRGSLKLLEAFIVDKLNGEKRFALNLEPRALRRTAYFGIDLVTLIERERDTVGMDVPVVLKRLIDEIERRGVDSSVLKDFLRELPEPLVPGCVFQMMVDGWQVRMPNDTEGNARLMLGVVDCMPRIHKCTLMIIMDHLKGVSAQSTHNGVPPDKLSTMFGPLLFCTTHPRLSASPEIAASAIAAGLPLPPAATEMAMKKSVMNFLDARLAADVLAFLLNIWPGRTSSSESSGSDNSTINLTNYGELSLLNVWLQENKLPESTC